jgi:hypothetical protein
MHRKILTVLVSEAANVYFSSNICIIYLILIKTLANLLLEVKLFSFALLTLVKSVAN